MSHLKIIDGTYLKLLAAALMLVDHIGAILFPEVLVLRIIGRLSFPIFAFMISEGAKYTKNKLRYFLIMFSVGVICQIAFYIAYEGLTMCILITFSASVLLIYAMQHFKRCLFSDRCHLWMTVFALLIFALGVFAMAVLNYHPFFKNTLGITFDAGFSGCLAPVFASLPDFRGIDAPISVKKFDILPARLLCFALALISLIPINSIQWVSLFALIPLFMYSEKRGRFSLKYFFYVFYPLHLGALWLVYMLIR